MFNIFNNDDKEAKVKTMKKFRQFLEEENENIKNKLMKVYCIMNFEIKNKLKDIDLDDKEATFEIRNNLFDIDEILLYLQDDEHGSGSKNKSYKKTKEKLKKEAEEREREKEKESENEKEITDKTKSDAPKSPVTKKRRVGTVDPSLNVDINIMIKNKIKEQKEVEFNEVENLHKIKDKYIIKFEIILIYYTLNMYLEEVFLERTDYFKTDQNEIWESIKSNTLSIVNVFINIIKLPYHIGKFIYKNSLAAEKKENESTRDIFDKIYDLEEIMEQNRKETEKSKQIETAMTEFLKTNIKTVEIVLNDVVYKIYFPILSKCREMHKIEKKLLADSENLENYTYQNLNLYKEITIELKENYG